MKARLYVSLAFLTLAVLRIVGRHFGWLAVILCASSVLGQGRGGDTIWLRNNGSQAIPANGSADPGQTVMLEYHVSRHNKGTQTWEAFTVLQTKVVNHPGHYAFPAGTDWQYLTGTTSGGGLYVAAGNWVMNGNNYPCNGTTVPAGQTCYDKARVKIVPVVITGSPIKGTQPWTSTYSESAWGSPDAAGANNYTFVQNTVPVLGTVAFDGDLIVPARSALHSIALKVNGVTINTASSAPNAEGEQNVDLSGIASGVNTTGSTFEWLIDGVSQGGPQTLVFTNIGSIEQPLWRATISIVRQVAAGGAPTPTPATTATPTATPTPTPMTTATPWGGGATPTPAPGSSPPPTIIVGPGPGGTGNVNSQAVTVMNPGDIYTPITNAIGKLPTARDIYDNVKNALNDAGNNLAGPGTAAPGGAVVTDLSNRGNLDQLQGKLEEGLDGIEDTKTAAIGKIQGVTDSFQTLPTTFGQVTSINLGLSWFNSIPIVGGISNSFPESISLAPYMDGIALVRLLLLWILTIAFGFLTLRALAWN